MVMVKVIDRAVFMRHFLDKLYLACGAIGAGFIALIALLMLVQSIAREFGVRTGAVNDVVAWSCAAASFFAMAHAFKHGDFVRVTLVLEKLNAATRRKFEIASLLIGAIATAYLAYSACLFTLESYEFNDMAQGLWAIPIWIPQTSFVLGSILLFVAVMDELVIVLCGGVPTFVRLTAERHAKGDFSADV
jgi:TRAP-type C4-dicarboxylate transport system permease small subunit